MAKFIIEVSDGYISERCDMDNIMKTYTTEQMPMALADLVVFKFLEQEIKNGVSEFYVNSSEVDEEMIRILNDAVREAGMMYSMKVSKQMSGLMKPCTTTAEESN